MTNADDVTDRPWLTFSQAAAQSGRHIGALRSMVRRERIPARKGNRNQWLVQLPAELLAEPDAGTTLPCRDPCYAGTRSAQWPLWNRHLGNPG